MHRKELTVEGIMTAAISIWILILATLSCSDSCRADYTLFLIFHSYLNPLSNRADTGQCCDSQTMPPCTTRCDNIFTICLLRTGQALPARGSDIQSEECPLGFFRSQKIDNRDNITFNSSFPITFTGDAWPISFQLLIQVFDDDDGNPDDFIDTLVIEQTLTPSLSPTLPTNFPSSAGIFSLVLSFRVECFDNLYGDACDVFCVDRNESILGHFTCDSQGQKVCLPGYQNVDSNCTECVPAEGCSMVGGYCNEPDECLCYEGYEGVVCDTLQRNQSHDNHVTAIIAGVVVSVVVIVVVVVIIVLVLAILWWKKNIIFKCPSKGLVPGDNPTYMSSADLQAVDNSPSSHLPSPTHSTTDPSQGTLETTPIEDLVSTTTGDPGDDIFDDTVYSTSPPITQWNLNPYGNYGDKTITRVAGLAPSPPIFDESKYEEWTPPLSNDNDDVDSDCQSEYL